MYHDEYGYLFIRFCMAIHVSDCVSCVVSDVVWLFMHHILYQMLYHILNGYAWIRFRMSIYVLYFVSDFVWLFMDHMLYGCLSKSLYPNHIRWRYALSPDQEVNNLRCE